jgi:hypothetical protein
MESRTAWVKPPKQITGLDHLAVQAPCINIYGNLLPGITNVTDRARYYSFYPWLIWALDRKGYSTYDDEFVSLFRRADCLYTLVAKHHELTAEDHDDSHAAAVIGINTLGGVGASVLSGNEVRLSDYAHRDDKKERYFKNKLGGLGQYYLGVLREMFVLDGDSTRGVRYTREIGAQLAAAMDENVPGSTFLSIVEGDSVTSKALAELTAFCPCQIAEQRLLCDLFFVRELFDTEESLARRRTLQLIVQLARDLNAASLELDENNFRGCVYSASLPGGSDWILPEILSQTRALWAIYEKNELMSLALQGLFFALLDAYEESGARFFTVKEIADWFAEQREVGDSLNVIGDNATYGELVKQGTSTLPTCEIRIMALTNSF